MINFRSTRFLKSTTTLKDAPKGRLPEVLIVGRSNAGKSSLINAICENKSLAFTSSKPGHTKLLNYFEIDSKMYLVDAPGYGYAVGGLDLDKLFGQMMDQYFSNNLFLKLCLLLVDSRREFNEEDLEMINYFKEQNVPYLIVLTKGDKINQKERAQAKKRMVENGVSDYLITSINDKNSLMLLKKEIERRLKL